VSERCGGQNEHPVAASSPGGAGYVARQRSNYWQAQARLFRNRELQLHLRACRGFCLEVSVAPYAKYLPEMTSCLDCREEELLTTVALVADEFAEVLLARERKAEANGILLPPEGRNWRRLKKMLCSLSAEREDIRMDLVGPSGGTLTAQLEVVAARMITTINDDYISTFVQSEDKITVYARHAPLHKFRAAKSSTGHEIPRFEADQAFGEDASAHLALLQALYVFDAILSGAVGHTPGTMDVFDMPPKETTVTIAFDALKGENTVKILAERLYRSLHQGRPCKVEDHFEDHRDALGACTGALVKLDPRWITQGAHDGKFSVILAGDGIEQECEVRLAESRYEPHHLRVYDSTWLTSVQYQVANVSCLLVTL
jgi:hypothetical protein